MEEIKIRQTDKGFFVEQGNEEAKEIGWEDMLGLIARLTMPEVSLSQAWMKEKEDQYQPKSGDFVTYTYSNGNKYVAIFQCRDNNLVDCYYVDLRLENKDKECVGSVIYDDGFDTDYVERRPATKEEKQLLINALHKEGKEWNEDKKKIVNYRWTPIKGDRIYVVVYNFSEVTFGYDMSYYRPDIHDIKMKRNMVFKTQEEVEKRVKDLNENLLGKNTQ